MTTRVLRGGSDAHGAAIDVRIDDDGGTVVDVAAELHVPEGEEVVDCVGSVVLTAPAEPHVHLDKVDTASRLVNPTGELMDAVRVWMDHVPDLDADEVRDRAVATIDDYVASGTTAIRSHVNLSTGSDLAPLLGLLAARDAVRDRCEVQLVVLVPRTMSGSEAAEANRSLVRRAVELGVDLVGGAPHTGADPSTTTDALVGIAHELGVGVDLHTDETLDPAAVSLAHLARRVDELGLGGRATASHCVSLGVQSPEYQAEVCALLAATGVSVVALPATNLWLQARHSPSAPPRGLTAVRPLLDAGVTVAAGADNLRDPFCPIGRADPLETAALLAVTGHLGLHEAWRAVSDSARTVMGLPRAGPRVGATADLLVVAGRDLPDAVARASSQRLTVRRGRVVARTTTSTTWAPGEGSR